MRETRSQLSVTLSPSHARTHTLTHAHAQCALRHPCVVTLLTSTHTPLDTPSEHHTPPVDPRWSPRPPRPRGGAGGRRRRGGARRAARRPTLPGRGRGSPAEPPAAPSASPPTPRPEYQPDYSSSCRNSAQYTTDVKQKHSHVGRVVLELLFFCWGVERQLTLSVIKLGAWRFPLRSRALVPNIHTINNPHPVSERGSLLTWRTGRGPGSPPP